MFTPTASQSPRSHRAPKPRAFCLPVVRPVPPRPAGEAIRTW
jgi:hypothetical protein